MEFISFFICVCGQLEDALLITSRTSPTVPVKRQSTKSRGPRQRAHPTPILLQMTCDWFRHFSFFFPELFGVLFPDAFFKHSKQSHWSDVLFRLNTAQMKDTALSSKQLFTVFKNTSWRITQNKHRKDALYVLCVWLCRLVFWMCA